MAKPKKVKVLPESDVQCQSCAHLLADEDGEEWGYCLRFPPQVLDSSDETTKTMFPTVKFVWRCGEFRRKLDS